MACVIGDRPVILLGQKYDEPGRVAFLVAHETAHIINEDCSVDCLIVDEDEDLYDDDMSEQRADRYGRAVLVGDDRVPMLSGADFQSIANDAFRYQERLGMDSGYLIWNWAKESKNYQIATMATKALYRATGARMLLRQHFDSHVDIEAANEVDRTILRCVFGDPTLYEDTD